MGIWDVSIWDLEGRTERLFLGLVNFVPAVAYRFCLNYPAIFSQPGNGLIVQPCTLHMILEGWAIK